MRVVSKRVDVLPGSRQKVTAIQALSFYNEAPQDELSLDEFELFALDRLQLLRGIEAIKARGFDGKEFEKKAQALENKYMPKPKDPFMLDSLLRKDVASHFILRLAYCRTEDLRRWFLTQECSLFKYRLEQLLPSEKSAFMAANGLDYDIVSQEEKDSRREELLSMPSITEAKFAYTTFIKIPFQQALQLVSSRQVYLEGGFAYVPLPRLETIILIRFRTNLSRSLAEATHRFDHVAADTRIGPLLKNMNKQYVGKDFGKEKATEKLTPASVDEAAENHMPLCMKHLHKSLKAEHKLKHWGRLQYGLFLKGAGLELDDAVAFWESHFTKAMSHDQFVKGYGYMFRHMYGREGARKNYTPYSCFKIIMGTPPEAGAHHGCPYRHMPDTQLSNLLSALRLGATETKDIVGLAKSGNYQVACLKHFEITHPGFAQLQDFRIDGIADHPNQWFRASVTYSKIKAGGISVKTEPGASSITSPSSSAAPAASGSAAEEDSHTDMLLDELADFH